MISRIGYTDNKTAFGAYYIKNENYYRLFDASFDLCVGNKKQQIKELTNTFAKNTPNHGFEIFKISSEGNTCSAEVRNIDTGASAEFESKSLESLLFDMTEKLVKMAERKVAFWSEKSDTAIVHRNLTKQ